MCHTNGLIEDVYKRMLHYIITEMTVFSTHLSIKNKNYIHEQKWTT